MSIKNIKFPVIGVFIVLLLLGVTFFLIYEEESDKAENSTNIQEKSSTIKEPVASVPSPDEASEPPEDLSPAKKEVVEKERQFRKRIAEQANRPLEFYGKVVDQAGQPVPGVQIQARIAYHQGIWVPQLKQEVFYVRTDGKGRFAITNQKGTNLYIEKLHKKGYISEVGPTSFKAHYSSDPETATPEPPYDQDPVVFKIWKKPEPADLIQGSKKVGGIGGDGAYYPNESFQTVRIPATDGAVQIRFRTDPEGEQYNPGNWSVTLKIENGGLIEAEKVYMYQAPREGYQSTWQASFEKGKEGFKSEIRRKFYLKAKGGSVYGRLEMNFDPYVGEVDGEKTSGLSFKYRINPHGSRNLLGKYD